MEEIIYNSSKQFHSLSSIKTKYPFILLQSAILFIFQHNTHSFIIISNTIKVTVIKLFMSMSHSQQLFEINKRINQIQQHLHLRHEKAHQWNVPYEKILNKNNLSKTLQGKFTNNSYQQLQNEKPVIFKSKTERKLFYKKKVKQSRKKINQFPNELKQLQQLKERKTKLYIKKQTPQPKSNQKQEFGQYERKNSSFSSTQVNSTNKNLNNSMLLTGVMTKSSFIHPVRNLKDRVNPFQELKPELMIELYQQAKHLGKQNISNHSLGVGIDFTPYSHFKRDSKKDQESQQKKFLQNISGYSNVNKDLSNSKINRVNSQKLLNSNHLSKILGGKVQKQKQIYLDSPNFLLNQKPSISSRKNKSSNIFQKRMKKLLQQKNTIQACQGNYIQLLKEQRKIDTNRIGKSNIGKVKANNTYKAVLGQM